MGNHPFLYLSKDRSNHQKREILIKEIDKGLYSNLYINKDKKGIDNKKNYQCFL